jgi:hypothetical protein
MGSRRFIFVEEETACAPPARFRLVRLVITGLIAGGFSAWCLLGGARGLSPFG